MDAKKTSKRKKNKPRSYKTNDLHAEAERGSFENVLLATPGLEEVYRPEILEEVEESECNFLPESQLLSSPIENFEEMLEKIKNVLVDQITIQEGDNTIKIELSRKHNRVYKIDLYFNGCELRPSTYTGKSSAMNYWRLLKGLNK